MRAARPHCLLALGIALAAGVLALELEATATAGSTPASDAGRTARTCRLEGSRNLVSTGRSRLFTKGPRHSGAQNPVWACHYRYKRKFRLGYTDCFNADGVEQPRLAGRYAGYARASCNQGGTYTDIAVRDLRTGRYRTRVDAAPDAERPGPSVLLVYRATDLGLATSGGVAWIVQIGHVDLGPSPPPASYRYEVRKSDAEGQNVLLASGPDITPDSLSLSGSTMSWVQGGHPSSGMLRRPPPSGGTLHRASDQSPSSAWANSTRELIPSFP